MKLTKNQKLVLKALKDFDNWKPSMTAIKIETGIVYNKSIIRVYHSLLKKKLINKQLRPIYKPFEIKTDGTKQT